MKRGRGSFKKEVGGSDTSGKKNKNVGGGMGSATTSTTSINWCPMPDDQKLPEQPGKVGLLDTNLPTMKSAATNPTGAVGVVTYEEQTYCFSSSCPSCQIPLTKAKVLPASEESDGGPRLVCDFCKATYNLKDGSKLAAAESGGLFGGVVKSVFASQTSGPLPLYKLGERNGKLVVAVD